MVLRLVGAAKSPSLKGSNEMNLQSSSFAIWTGRILTAVFAVFMLAASIAPKLLNLSVARDNLTQLGWPSGYVLMIGLIELTCLVLYLIPRTALLGAVLMMGLLGGAMATQIRAGSPLFSHILFGVYLAVFMWGGLWLRDARVRALFPVMREREAQKHTS
jgi:DoxX-like family